VDSLLCRVSCFRLGRARHSQEQGTDGAVRKMPKQASIGVGVERSRSERPLEEATFSAVEMQQECVAEGSQRGGNNTERRCASIIDNVRSGSRLTILQVKGLCS
jgi:hypothetical protein